MKPTAITDMRFNSIVSQTRMKKICRLIDAAPHGLTSQQLKQQAEIHERTLQQYLSYMHNDTHQIHIGGWILPKEGRALNVYKTGDLPDVPRPSVHADDACFLRQHPLHVPRKQADEELLPVRRQATNIKPHSDPMIDLFFGRVAA